MKRASDSEWGGGNTRNRDSLRERQPPGMVREFLFGPDFLSPQAVDSVSSQIRGRPDFEPGCFDSECPGLGGRE